MGNFFYRLVYGLYERMLWNQIKDGPRPHHVAFIMDGNRRFAKKIGLGHVKYGHQLGAKKVDNILRWCWNLDIKVVTLYAFSLENFQRPPDEVEAIMNLARQYFVKLAKDRDVHDYRVRVKAIGRLNLLPPPVQAAIKHVEEVTMNHDQYLLQIAIGYSGRAELVDAVKAIARKVKQGLIDVDEIDEDYIDQHLYTGGAPDPDLIIRTSGEERLSGFLLWQSAYSELYFADVYFPAFRKIDLWRAIRTFQKRERRFGK